MNKYKILAGIPQDASDFCQNCKHHRALTEAEKIEEAQYEDPAKAFCKTKNKFIDDDDYTCEKFSHKELFSEEAAPCTP
jgi:hypothetical protein